MHRFSKDFYGEKLKIVILGQIRPMTTFENKCKFLRKENLLFITWKKNSINLFNNNHDI